MILVYLELSGGKVTKGTLTAIGAALAAKKAHGYGKAAGILFGASGTEAAAKEAAAYGLDEVLWAEGSEFTHYFASSYAEAMTAAAREIGATMCLGLDSSHGKDFLPRVAQALDAGQVSSCMAFLEGKKFRRPMYAGNIVADVEVTSANCVVSVRGTAFEPAARAGSASSVRRISPGVAAPANAEFVSFNSVESERPELTEAEFVVSGGRALKSAENFEKYILPLADALGGAVGASRAAVDSGYAPNDWQVGQTGKIVAPKLYIAVGISGAIQHLAGMKDSKVIVAINKDAEAPIFEMADYGLVADLFEAVPQLTEAIRKVRGG